MNTIGDGDFLLNISTNGIVDTCKCSTAFSTHCTVLYSIALQLENTFSVLGKGQGVAYTKLQQRKKEESEKLRGERDQIKCIYLRFARWQVVRLRKARRRQDVP